MRPNLLFIIAHDLGRCNSVYGTATDTPNLEAFSREATCFTSAFATAPTCSPSRASLMTGLYPHQHGLTGLTHLGFRMARTDRHLAQHLRTAGYRTILSGVQHEAPTWGELGYQEYLGADPEAVYQPDFEPVGWDRTNAAACAAFLRDHALGDTSHEAGVSAGGSVTPWFLSLGLFLPHRPFPDPEDETSSRVSSSLAAVPGLPDIPDVRREMQGFFAAVREMDRSIGTVLAALWDAHLDETTVVVVVTDHGIDMPRYKNTLSDGGLAVTLMVHTPGQRRRAVCSSLVSLVDLYPTVLHLLGVPLPADMHISDAQSIAAGCHSHQRTHAFSGINYHVAYQPERAVTTERYRLVHCCHTHHHIPANIGDSPSKDAYLREYPRETHATGTPGGPAPWQLYDRWYDPLQNRNLWDEDTLRETAGELQQELHRWMVATGDPLLTGEAPLPVGASIAPPESYSSRSADIIRDQGVLP